MVQHLDESRARHGLKGRGERALGVVRRSPALAAALAASLLVLSPFMAVAAVILMVGTLCCLPIIVTAGMIGALVWLGPRAGELARLWKAELRKLISRARASPAGFRLEGSLRANPLLAAGALCCSPALIPMGLLALVTACTLVVCALPLLIPGACLLLANPEFRTAAAGLSQRTAERVCGALDWPPLSTAILRSAPTVHETPSPRPAASAEPGAQSSSAAAEVAAQAPAQGAPSPQASVRAVPAEAEVQCAEAAAAPADTSLAAAASEAAPSTPPVQRTDASESSTPLTLQQPGGKPRASSPTSARSEVSSTASSKNVTPTEGGGRKRRTKHRSKQQPV